mgnify:CR=1 FL=1
MVKKISGLKVRMCFQKRVDLQRRSILDLCSSYEEKKIDWEQLGDGLLELFNNAYFWKCEDWHEEREKEVHLREMLMIPFAKNDLKGFLSIIKAELSLSPLVDSDSVWEYPPGSDEKVVSTS